jgi:hypothetical protein
MDLTQSETLQICYRLSRTIGDKKYLGHHYSVTSKKINVNQALTSSQH